jgi:hypothetical protein
MGYRDLPEILWQPGIAVSCKTLTLIHKKIKKSAGLRPLGVLF